MDKLVSNKPQGFLDDLIHVLFVPYIDPLEVYLREFDL